MAKPVAPPGGIIAHIIQMSSNTCHLQNAALGQHGGGIFDHSQLTNLCYSEYESTYLLNNLLQYRTAGFLPNCAALLLPLPERQTLALLAIETLHVCLPVR